MAALQDVRDRGDLAVTRITIREILAARDTPAASRLKSGWSRALLETWGVPWPVPVFWMERLQWSGIPYREPTLAEIAASPSLRAVIWVPAEIVPPPEPPPEPQKRPPERAEPEASQSTPPEPVARPAPVSKPRRAAKLAPPKPPQGLLL